MNEHNVFLLNRAAREEAARLRRQRELRRLATMDRRPLWASLGLRLWRLFRPVPRPAQPIPTPRYPLPCPPAREPANL